MKIKKCQKKKKEGKDLMTPNFNLEIRLVEQGKTNQLAQIIVDYRRLCSKERVYS